MLVGVDITTGVVSISISVCVGAGVVRGGPCNDDGFDIELKEDVNAVIVVVSTGSINSEGNATGVDIKSIMIASDVVNIPSSVDAVSDTSEDDETVGPGICTAQTNTSHVINT